MTYSRLNALVFSSLMFSSCLHLTTTLAKLHSRAQKATGVATWELALKRAIEDLGKKLKASEADNKAFKTTMIKMEENLKALKGYPGSQQFMADAHAHLAKNQKEAVEILCSDEVVKRRVIQGQRCGGSGDPLKKIVLFFKYSPKCFGDIF